MKTVVWYDNEWRYSVRVADMAYYIARRARGDSGAEIRRAIAAHAPELAVAEEVTA